MYCQRETCSTLSLVDVANARHVFFQYSRRPAAQRRICRATRRDLVMLGMTSLVYDALAEDGQQERSDLETTDRVFLNLGLCANGYKKDRRLGDPSILCDDPESLGRIVIDLYGGVAAALAQASVVFKNAGDSGFASKLIAAAKELYSWGDGKPGKYSNYFKDQTKIYRSSGGDDSMAAAAGWLYRATGDRSWLDKALKYWDYEI